MEEIQHIEKKSLRIVISNTTDWPELAKTYWSHGSNFDKKGLC